MSNRIKSRDFLAAHAADRWRAQYEGKCAYLFSGEPWGVKHRALVALGPKPDPDDVDRIIGNKSWTRNTCDECNADADTVQVGQAPDYESRTADLCEACLRRALSAFGGVV